MDVTVLALTCLVLTLVVAVLAGSVPYLWWQLFDQRRRLDTLRQEIADLDEVVARLCGLAGLQPETAPPRNGVAAPLVRRGG